MSTWSPLTPPHVRLRLWSTRLQFSPPCQSHSSYGYLLRHCRILGRDLHRGSNIEPWRASGKFRNGPPCQGVDAESWSHQSQRVLCYIHLNPHCMVMVAASILRTSISPSNQSQLFGGLVPDFHYPSLSSPPLARFVSDCEIFLFTGERFENQVRTATLWPDESLCSLFVATTAYGIFSLLLDTFVFADHVVVRFLHGPAQPESRLVHFHQPRTSGPLSLKCA